MKNQVKMWLTYVCIKECWRTWSFKIELLRKCRISRLGKQVFFLSFDCFTNLTIISHVFQNKKKLKAQRSHWSSDTKADVVCRIPLVLVGKGQKNQTKKKNSKEHQKKRGGLVVKSDNCDDRMTMAIPEVSWKIIKEIRAILKN